MPPTASTVLGVDGCPGGWVGVLVGEDGVRSWHCGDFAAMLALPVDLVAVDIPIGLPDGPARRQADLDARLVLGVQRSSVFFTPPRAVLAATTQAEATLLSRAAGSTGVSVQTFWILQKVAEVDAALADPQARRRVVEVHPEVSFRAMAHDRVLARKKLALGRAQRAGLLAAELPGAAVPVPRPGRAAPDDCLDALAAAWTGLRVLRGEADELGGGEVDATGLPMRILV